MTTQDFYVVDVREEWTKAARHPFVTLWGPDNVGYVYSLERAGRYTIETLTPGYHYQHVYGSTRGLLRYPVACKIVEAMAVPVPDDLRQMWRDVRGPIILNTGKNRTALRAARFLLGDPSAFDKRKAAA